LIATQPIVKGKKKLFISSGKVIFLSMAFKQTTIHFFLYSGSKHKLFVQELDRIYEGIFSINFSHAEAAVSTVLINVILPSNSTDVVM